MGTSDISGIGKVVVQGQTADVKGSAQEEDLTVAFAEVMSQMSAMAGEGAGVATRAELNTEFKEPLSQTDTGFERCQSRGVQIQESSKAEPGQKRLSEKTEKFAEDVEEVLQGELGVSKEQIEKAMETLGLTFSDLLNPNQLANLVAELTGTENMSELLCSEAFMTIMQEVGALSENLLQELGITADELTQIFDSAENIADTMTDEQMIQTENAAQNAKAAEDTVNEMPKLQKDADRLEAYETSENADAKLTVNEKVQDEEPESSDESAVRIVADNDTDEATKSENGRDETFSGQQNTGDAGAETRNDMTASVNQNVAETDFSQVQNAAGETASQVDVAEIMKQIVEYSKVTIGNQETTMELQLNPENLGKIYMEITSKDGVVSAHITAQNEVVKEALESQLIELRQNLNQAGVKVEAVEVTVESHEFEKDLEQNSRQQEEQAAQQEKASKGTRRINLNDLDELGGLMTEEENLVAQMMADQGNSVDYTA